MIGLGLRRCQHGPQGTGRGRQCPALASASSYGRSRRTFGARGRSRCAARGSDAFVLRRSHDIHRPDQARAGCKIICQVQALAQAMKHAAAGADIIIAQGRDAGGHSGMTREPWAWFPRWLMRSRRFRWSRPAASRMGVVLRLRSHWVPRVFRWEPDSPLRVSHCGPLRCRQRRRPPVAIRPNRPACSTWFVVRPGRRSILDRALQQRHSPRDGTAAQAALADVLQVQEGRLPGNRAGRF